MNKITKMIRKVATTARKAVLLGALVGGVSMASFATETTETNVGPTIEKAQLETVHINLKTVVDAITKVDPDWVRGLPVVRGKQEINTGTLMGIASVPNNLEVASPATMVLTATYYYMLDTDGPEENEEENWVLLDDEDEGCDDEGEILCTIQAPAGPGEHPNFTGITNVRTSPLVKIESYKQIN